ncbi:MAG: alpha/beta hydrolase [Saprospiraceae bacterium]|nr:alpha/beta hydrolase [Saprospiraceae bacterium]
MYKITFALLSGLLLASCQLEDWASPGALVPLTVDQDPDLPALAINGTLLHVQSYGASSDPLLVMLHGGPGGDFRSLLQARRFAEAGFYVVFYDQRGSGLSKREDKNRYEGADAVQLFIDDLDALISHFQIHDSQKVFLMGHSWGAMLAAGYINQHPGKISGAVLAEPGGFTWTQTGEYLSRSNSIRFFSEALNDAIFPEQILAGRSEHEVLDYKASFFSNYENAPGNVIGNAGPYPFWRNGAVAFEALIDNADRYGFDFTTQLHQFTPKVLFLYSEYNEAYGRQWAETVAAPFPHVEIKMIAQTGHEMLHFGWAGLYPVSLTYLNELK